MDQLGWFRCLPSSRQTKQYRWSDRGTGSMDRCFVNPTCNYSNFKRNISSNGYKKYISRHMPLIWTWQTKMPLFDQNDLSVITRSRFNSGILAYTQNAGGFAKKKIYEDTDRFDSIQDVLHFCINSSPPWQKWLPFRRYYFQNPTFSRTKVLYCDENFTEVCSLGSNWQ